MKRTLLRLLISIVVVAAFAFLAFFVYTNFIARPKSTFEVTASYYKNENTAVLLSKMQEANTKYAALVPEASTEQRLVTIKNLTQKLDGISGNLKDYLVFFKLSDSEQKNINKSYNNLTALRKELITELNAFILVLDNSSAGDYTARYDDVFKLSCEYIKQYSDAVLSLNNKVTDNFYNDNPNLIVVVYDISIRLCSTATAITEEAAFKDEWLASFTKLNPALTFENGLPKLTKSHVKEQGIYNEDVKTFMNYYDKISDKNVFAGNFDALLKQKVDQVGNDTSAADASVYYFSLIFGVV